MIKLMINSLKFVRKEKIQQHTQGGDRGAGRGPGSCKKIIFLAPPLTIFILLA